MSEPQLSKSLELAQKALDNMSKADLYKSIYGYTIDEERAYTEESFKTELDYLRTFFVDGSYTFHPEDAPHPEISNLFWNYAQNNARSDYEDLTATFPTYYIELPNFGIRITSVYGQGTLTTVADFDYSTPEYMVRNASRLKRESAWRKQEELQNFLKDKPNYLDEVKFSTTIDGTVIEDTGVIERVYTSKGILRYLIDSVNHGKVIVFYQNETHVNDVIEIVVLHPDNYDGY
jgi:hypothetical protein